MTEAQQRFLRAIAERLGERQPVEVRLFPSIRPGHYESGVAVVAIEGELATGEVVPAGTLVAEGSSPASSGLPASNAGAPEASAPVDHTAVADESSAGPVASAAESAAGQNASVADDSSRDPARRLSILTARYRLTLKGPDRGKWEFSLVHDADAPLDTIDPVVRGVARRVGDVDEPQLLDAQAFARAIAEPWWTTTA
ncbi:MAG TPA: hypothetical protein VF178_10810 [Gemmatimonadaceae bacterium]